MKWKSISGLAATLAFLALTVGPVASAALTIQGSKGSVTYAKETLPSAGAVSIDGTNYYKIGHALSVAAPAGFAALANDSYTVTYTLSGMVFAASTPDSITGGTFQKISGGAANDSEVVYRLSSGTIGEATTDLSLAITFAVSESGGSITRTVTNSSLPSSVTRSKTLTGRVMVASALSETPFRADALASADLNFVDFGPNLATGTRIVTARLGSLKVGVKPSDGPTLATTTKADTRYRNAARTGDAPSATEAATPEEATATADTNGIIDHLREIMKGLGSTDANQSTATVAGDVSFVKSIGFSSGTTCGPVTDIRKPAKAPATGYSDEFKPMLVTDAAFSTPNRLCVTADGETAIPEGYYTVTTSYLKLDASAFGPVGTTHTLGEIRRDGTVHHIPYLTTYEGYNQRLILRNRSGRAVSYTVTFSTEMEIAATPTSVTGALAAGEVKVLRVQDMVALTGGNRTSATVTSNARSGRLDVGSTIVNLETRGTDTIRY